MVNFDNFEGLTSVLKFHIFLIFNSEELVRFRVICKILDAKNWYSIFTNLKNGTSSSHLITRFIIWKQERLRARGRSLKMTLYKGIA